MDEYVEIVVNQMILPWLDETWPNMPYPDVRYVEDGESGYEGCTDYDGGPARYSGESYEYCPPDRTIYLGQSLLWLFFEETGDAGPAMGIAHEFGHHIQDWLGVDPPYTSAESIDYENQADCIAGAWTGYTRDEGWLEVEDDLADIDMLFPIIASAESEDRDHGTEAEREDSFFDGYDRGIAACGLPRR
jgi:predicted metalloprotease